MQDLSGILYERGVDSKGFAIIRSKGEKALFHIDTNLLKRKLNAPDSRPLACAQGDRNLVHTDLNSP